jgi:hypothetical protein
MSGLNCRPVSRVKGRPALVRSLRGLLIRVHRYGRCRAATSADQAWAAAVIDALFAALAVADPRSDRRAP